VGYFFLPRHSFEILNVIVSCLFRQRKSRQAVSKRLGLAPFVVQSPRQQGTEPSPRVLSNALMAIIGAVWLDAERKNESVLVARVQILEILSQIKKVVADTGEHSLQTTREELSPVTIDEDGENHIATTNGSLSSLTPNDQETDPIGPFADYWSTEIEFVAPLEEETDGIQGTEVDPDHGLPVGGQSRFLYPQKIAVLANSSKSLLCNQTLTYFICLIPPIW